jgi:hypothetical protein
MRKVQELTNSWLDVIGSLKKNSQQCSSNQCIQEKGKESYYEASITWIPKMGKPHRQKENYGQMEEDTRRWKELPCSYISRINIKLAILLKAS